MATPEQPEDRLDVTELLRRRESIQNWLDRLDAQQGVASGKVLDRVRADYEARLRETLDALGSHRQAIHDELHDAEERLATAEQARAHAGDGLEEGHVRHRIGELDDADWDARRVRLEEAAERAHREELQATADVTHLRELLEQLEDRPPPPPPPPDQPETKEVPEPEPKDLTLEVGAANDSEAFLADIDRVLSEANGGDNEDEDDAGLTAPKPGLKCPDCGYTNDISAWFCGVCGSDIG